MSGKIKVAVIACGGRSKYVVSNLLRDSDRNVEIVSVYDPDKEVAEGALKQWESPEARICDSYEEAINFPGVTWVMVFSPNAYHCEHILAAFAAGKNVFSEKVVHCCLCRYHFAGSIFCICPECGGDPVQSGRENAHAAGFSGS